MGRKVKKMVLSFLDKVALEKGFNSSTNKMFSRRCHIVLLKQERSSEDIALIFGITTQSVDKWCNRYLKVGLEGLKTKKGQGRKFILDIEKDSTKIRATIQQERQRIKLVHEELEQNLEKKFSSWTLKRFLKKLSASGNESDYV
jgi:putative transposase